MTAKRFATITTSTCEVHCPYCGEPVPNPADETDLWFSIQVKECEGPYTCNSCDKIFQIVTQGKVILA